MLAQSVGNSEYQTFYRGNRAPGHYRTLKQLAQFVSPDFMRLYNWRNYNRVASAAGPLTPEYAVKAFRLPLSWGVKNEGQRLERQAAVKLPIPPADAGKGSGAKSGAAKSATRGAIGRAFAAVAKLALMPGGKSGGNNFEEEFDDAAMPTRYGPGNECSCVPISKKQELGLA